MMRPAGVLLLAVLALAASVWVATAAADDATWQALTTAFEAENRAGNLGKAFEAALVREGFARREYGGAGPRYADALKDLGFMKKLLGRYDEAEQDYVRALAVEIAARGASHPYVARTHNYLANLYMDTGRLREAEQEFKAAVQIGEQAPGVQPTDLATWYQNLGILFYAQGRLLEAEVHTRRALDLSAQIGEEDAVKYARYSNNYGVIKVALGRYGEAEYAIRRAIEIDTTRLRPNHPDLAWDFSSLGLLYVAQGRIEDAVAPFERALAMRRAYYSGPHTAIAASLTSLAKVYGMLKRPDAEALMREALAIDKAVLKREDHPSIAKDLLNLAEFLLVAGRPAEARKEAEAALRINGKEFGETHQAYASGMQVVGRTLLVEGRLLEALAQFDRALSITARTLGERHPATAELLTAIADARFQQGEMAASLEAFRRAAQVHIDLPRAFAHSDRPSQAHGARAAFTGFLRAAWRSRSFADEARVAALSSEAFELAQHALVTAAGKALSLLAERARAEAVPALAEAVRGKQDLNRRIARLDEKLFQTATSQATASSQQRLSEQHAERARLLEDLKQLELEIAQKLPSYAPEQTVTIGELRSRWLAGDEALVLFFPTPEETFVWAVTREAARWERIDLGTMALGDLVQTLRCGLDRSAWRNDGAERCTKLAGGELDPSNDSPLPFRVDAAHELYRALFGGIEDVVRGKQLLIVPAGPLSQLPFHVLVTKRPAMGGNGADALRRVAWMARRQATTVLPEVSSLPIVRRNARAKLAKPSFIGVGNPVLDGHPERSGNDVRRRAARYRQDCSLPQSPEEALLRHAEHFRVVSLGATATTAEIRRWDPVPETARLLCDIAGKSSFESTVILLGNNATERKIRELSRNGALAKLRVVHFATHGVLAGQIKGIAEPGLILTPPEQGSIEDDGYLSASEIAELKLDADWVILSACNTAAGGPNSGEALSGLARAFIYAQARALLVSHWSVDVSAATKLATRTLALLENADIGRSQALRQAMSEIIEGGAPHEVHPAFWAPFIVVGEGRQ